MRVAAEADHAMVDDEPLERHRFALEAARLGLRIDDKDLAEIHAAYCKLMLLTRRVRSGLHADSEPLPQPRFEVDPR